MCILTAKDFGFLKYYILNFDVDSHYEFFLYASSTSIDILLKILESLLSGYWANAILSSPPVIEILQIEKDTTDTYQIIKKADLFWQLEFLFTHVDRVWGEEENEMYGYVPSTFVLSYMYDDGMYWTVEKESLDEVLKEEFSWVILENLDEDELINAKIHIVREDISSCFEEILEEEDKDYNFDFREVEFGKVYIVF